MITNTEYMSDPARAERTVRRFMDITLRELKRMQTRDYIGYITNKLVLTEGLSLKKLPDMSYAELACLIHHVGGKPQYDGYSHDSRAQQMAYYRCVADILQDGRRRSIPVRLFMALPMRAFYTCLKRVCKTGSKSFDALLSLCSHKDGYTIGDFLAEKTRTLSKAWQPIMPLDAYERIIKDSYRDVGIVLIDCFCMVCPQQLHAEEICNKYAFSPEEDGAGHPLLYAADDEDVPSL